MKLLCLILFLLPFSLKASSFHHEFQKLGFYALTQTGASHLGIDRVYFKSEREFVLIKTNLEGSYPLETPIETPQGLMIYRKVGKTSTLFYFRGMNQENVKLIMRKLNRSVTTLPFNLPHAHASDCQEALGAPVLDSEGDLKEITAFASWDLLKGCLSGMGEGAYASTMGVAKSLAQEAVSFAQNPIQYMEKAGNQIEEFLVKTAALMKGLITQPDKTLSDLGRGMGESWEKISLAVREMSPEMKVSFVCNLVGALGIDAALIFISGGSLTPKIMLTLNSLAHKFTLSSKILSLLSKDHSRIRPEKREKFMQGLFLNKIPEGDLKHLSELTHLGEEMSLRTLACYIQ